jgi:hypothetical protein
MKAKKIFCVLIAFVVISANAQERGPVAISPACDAGIARVGVSCPTFSWTGMEWASGYKVVVFEANGLNVLSFEEMEAIASPILSKQIQGQAHSWTPSSDERLSSNTTYVWYVQAMDGFSGGIWSEGKVFKVEVEARLLGIGETVRESLKEHGVNDEVIDDVLRDMESGVREVVVWGADTESSKNKTQDKVGIQGIEGTTNTFYGLDAGFSIAAGGYNNSFFGRFAGYSTTTGDYNTFMGYDAGYTNSTGQGNTFMGDFAGRYNTTASCNTFIGQIAGTNNTTGYDNTFIGRGAGFTNTIGYSNTFIGREAGYKNDEGIWNTFVGDSAGYKNDGGYANTYVGYQAGQNTVWGEGNVFIGASAGKKNVSGIANVFIGASAGYNELGSDKLYIENSTTDSPLIWGDFWDDILTVHGQLAIGTKSPAYKMEMETTGENAAFVLQRTDGATNYINATGSFGNFGTVSSHPLRLAVNSVWRMRLNLNNSLTMANGATCTAGGTWENSSSREYKENIQSLSTQEAIDTLKELMPVKYNYKVDKDEEHVGFIAEDVPDLVASKNRKGLSAMDVVAVLTKVVQEQQETIGVLQKEIEELKKKNE